MHLEFILGRVRTNANGYRGNPALVGVEGVELGECYVALGDAMAESLASLQR